MLYILVVVMIAIAAWFLGYLLDESRAAAREEQEREEAKIEANINKFKAVPISLWQSTCTAETPKSGAKQKLRARFAGNVYEIIAQSACLIGDARAVAKINGQDIFNSDIPIHLHGDHPAWIVHRYVAKELAATQKI